MPRIIELEINHLRGIRKFHAKFDKKLVCLIGRGDSGKSTILDAISFVLSPQWNLTFNDTDFYNCEVSNNIEIRASLIGIPEQLLTDDKYGLYIRGLFRENNQIKDELAGADEKVLTIQLAVDRSLEPKWHVVNSRVQEDKTISAAHRAILNCFMISDQIDRHFSWNKGNPLYSLLKLQDSTLEGESRNVVIEALRDAKSTIDENSFDELAETIGLVKSRAAAFGLDISNTQTSLDHKELSIKDGRVCLHDENIPFRLKGKGSKRLTSIAIQSALGQEGGVMLIDEIEQGLEPDRIKQLARSLKEDNKGQTFLTTHSRDVITELTASDLLIIHNDSFDGNIRTTTLDYDDDTLQRVVRACPEAFFAKRVIVCEGATEVGVCRALDKYRRSHGKEVMSFEDCAYVDGTGSEFPKRAARIKEVGLGVAVLCDSDIPLSPSKEALEEAGIKIFDCDSELSMERQVFNDLPWDGIKELLAYVMRAHQRTEESVRDSVAEKYEGSSFPDDWIETDSPEMRTALAKASVVKDKEWFKRIDHGEALGDVIFKYISQMDGKQVKGMLESLSEWIDQ